MIYTREQIERTAKQLVEDQCPRAAEVVRQLLKKTDDQAARIAQLGAQVQGLRDDAERNKVDAECFRWWVHEAAANPCLVATAIAKCVTEDEYRKVICGAMSAKDEAIDAARAATKGGAA